MRYKVVRDLQGGTFGMERAYTVEQWRKQAMCWCFTDENYDLLEYIYMLREDKVLESISGLWALEFDLVQGEEFKETYNDYEDMTVEEMYNSYMEE